MNTHERYVSLEVAKLLKKAGFDWECSHIYFCYIEDNNTWCLETNNKDNKRISELDYVLRAPTLAVAQKWLREVKHIWCEVTICFVMEDALMKTKYHGQCISTDYNNPEMIDCYNIETDTPEEALEKGIKKGCEYEIYK